MAEMSLDARMNRLIGQLEGIRRMIKGKRATDDVVQQIMAAGQALSRIGMLLLKEELVKAVVAGTKRGGSKSDVGAKSGSKMSAKQSAKSTIAKTLSGSSLKQSDIDSRAAKDVEKLLGKLFKM